MWRPAAQTASQTPKSSYLEIKRFRFAAACPTSYVGEIGTFSSIEVCPNLIISVFSGDKETSPNPEGSYIGEIGTFSFIEACPLPTIVLSRRDKEILLCSGLPKPQCRPILSLFRKQISKPFKSLYSLSHQPPKSSRNRYGLFYFSGSLAKPQLKSPYFGEIRGLYFVKACPNPNIVLLCS